MSKQRNFEGEEELQLQLLEVTQDPTYGKEALTHKRVPQLFDALEFDEEEDEQQAIKRLH